MKLSGAVRNHWANELPAAAGAANLPSQRLAPILYAQEAAKPQFTSCTDRDRVLK